MNASVFRTYQNNSSTINKVSVNARPLRAYPRQFNLTTGLVAIIVTLVISLSGGEAMAESEVASEVVGPWEGKAHIIVDWCKQKNLSIAVDIREDGTVSGKVGDATLTEGQLKRNRGWLGRKLRVKTDYIIIGKLAGPIVASENFTRSAVKIPIDAKNGKLLGGLHTSGSKFGGSRRGRLSAGSLSLERITKP